MARAYTAIAAVTVIALTFSTSLLAGPFEDGMNAYDRADYSTALRMWRSLADQGNPAAQSNLALMYAKGQGVPKDYVQAYMWSTLSAARGHQEGTKNRDSIAKGMTQAQISEAQKRANDWKPAGQAATAPAPAPAPARSPTSLSTTTTIIRR
jgi:TPR repeat protein